MKALRAILLLLESLALLLTLSVQSKIKKAAFRIMSTTRKVRFIMEKLKKKPAQPPSPSPSQAPTLKIKVKSESRAGRPIPSFPMQKKSSPKEILSPDGKGSSIGTISTIEGEGQAATPSEIKTCSALLDIPFRAVHLAWKDVPPLSLEELEYMAEPLADIFIDLDWMKWVKLKGAYIKLGWGLSIAVVSRVRGHELVKRAAKKESEKKASQDRVGEAISDRAKVDDGGKKLVEVSDPHLHHDVE